jgi:hypothetical protein
VDKKSKLDRHIKHEIDLLANKLKDMQKGNVPI